MSSLRLASFEIRQLFGLYTHKIDLQLDEHITIIIGPNGRGKTVCLRFIEALFRQKFSYFADVPFQSATFTFSEGQRITVTRAGEEFYQTADRTFGTIAFVIDVPGGDVVTWTPTSVDERVKRELRSFMGHTWEEVRPGVWVDETDGEELTLAEVIPRFRVPSKLAALLTQAVPQELTKLIDSIDCHLIETQRLLVLPSPGSRDPQRFGPYMSPRRILKDSPLAIDQKAQKLKSILKETLSKYATLSQSLDRSYPLRVFEAQGSTNLSQDRLRGELRQLDERREALMNAGILDIEYKTVTLRSGNIEHGVSMALEIYVKDANEKLDVFNNLRGRLDLFKELINRRFTDKRIEIDRENGFKIVSNNTRDVPLEKLSSGEQHQLILIFDLLFETTRNSLILIDEPELSLHIAWQKTIIESLSRIIALNAFDVVLATHSPAVVSRYFNLATELGPVDA